MDYATEEGIELVKEIIKDNDIVCFTGGGNLGSLYLENEAGKIEMKKSQEAYHQNRNLTISVRESQTLDVVKETFKSDVIYTPDMVLSLDIVPKELERDGVLFISRADKERLLMRL